MKNFISTPQHRNTATPQLRGLSFILLLVFSSLLFFSCSKEKDADSNLPFKEVVMVSDNISKEEITEFLEVVNSTVDLRSDYHISKDQLEEYLETALNYSFGKGSINSKKSKLFRGSLKFNVDEFYDANELKKMYRGTLQSIRNHKSETDFNVDFMSFVDVEIVSIENQYFINYYTKLCENEVKTRGPQIPPRWEFTELGLHAINGACNGGTLWSGYQGTPEEIGIRATYNVNRSYDNFTHFTNIISELFFTGDTYGYFSNMWDLSCGGDPNCNCFTTLGDCNCEPYYDSESLPQHELTPVGEAHFCLVTSELNTELSLCESEGVSWATYNYKSIMGFEMEYGTPLCGGLPKQWSVVATAGKISTQGLGNPI